MLNQFNDAKLHPLDQKQSKSELDLWLQNPIFAAMGKDACQVLVQRYAGVEFKAKSVVACCGQAADRLFILLDGNARIFHQTADGREAIVKLLRAPMVFGDIELFHNIPLLENVAAQSDILLSTIPVADYLELLEQYPKAMLEHLRHMAAAFCVAAKNERQVFAPLEQKIANLLISFAHYFGSTEEDGVLIKWPLSQQEIAKSLGTVRRSVANVLLDFKKQRLIDSRGQYVMILNPHKLEEIALPIQNSFCYYMGIPLDELAHQDRLTEAEIEIVSGPGSMAGRRYAVEDELTIGSAAPSKLILPDDLVSQIHCRVFRSATGSRFWLEDLESDNGTFINDKPVARGVVRNNDLLKVGSIKMVVRFSYPEAEQKTGDCAREA